MDTKNLFIVLMLGYYSLTFSQNSVAYSNSYALEYKKDYSGAIAALKDVDSESNYFTKVRMGWLYYLAGNYSASVENYKKSIALKPNSIEAMLGLTNPLFVLKKWEDLNSTYAKILSIDPNNYTANYRLGLSKYYAKQYVQAEEYTERVVKLYPFDYSANLLMAGVKLSLAKITEAKNYYNIVLLISPSDTTALEMLKSLK